MSRTCPHCSTLLPDGFPEGMCPKCLLGAVAPRARRPAERDVPELEQVREWFPELEITGLLGAGGMGAVYQARQPRLDRLVALKIMTGGAGDEEGFALRFEREAQVLARLRHPRIVIIHDVGEIVPERGGGRRIGYFLMEHVDGTDLGRLMRSGGVDPARALVIAGQICEGLQHAHDQGVTHRDIKPGNILLDEEGNVRIADFGLAKVAGKMDEAFPEGLTRTGSSMGTPHYMAPEQRERPESADHRADLHALGVVLYEMLTGERPAGFFTPLSQMAGIDLRLDAVVMRAMEKNPDRRYQQAREMGEDLARIRRSPPGQGWRPGRRLLGAAGVAAVVSMGVFVAARLPGPPREMPEAARHLPSAGAPADKRQTYRLVMVSTDPEAREHSPGAPWDEVRQDLVDLQVAETHINGYRGLPLDHGVTVALTREGKLLDWINTIPGKSIIPAELRDAVVVRFSIFNEENRSVALLSNGEVHAWSWSLNPERQTVSVSGTRKIDFGRAESPVDVRATGFETLIAIYGDGGIRVDSEGDSPIDESKVNGAVKDIHHNFLALLADGSLRDVARHDLARGPWPIDLPAGRAVSLRAGPFFPSAILEDGSLWYWNENGTDQSEQLDPLLERVRGKGRIADFRVHQSGDTRFAIRVESGDWFVSHGAMDDARRAELHGAEVVFREEDYVIGLVPAGMDNL